MPDTGLRDSGSFRDPSSHVYVSGSRVFRGIRGPNAAFLGEFLESAFYKERAGSAIVNSWVVSRQDLRKAKLPDDLLSEYDLWIEHQRLEFITYPYEWSFGQLRRAAIFQLDLNIQSLEAGFQLKDASAYNIQFVGNQPTFIDLPSFEIYQEGQPWIAYKQFCEMFFAPLVLHAYTGVSMQPWIRGNLDGIDLVDCSRVLPWKSYLSASVLGHIHAHAMASKKVSATSQAAEKKKVSVKKENLISLMKGLQSAIKGLKSRSASYWKDYENQNSYSSGLVLEKEQIVSDFAAEFAGKRLLDIGCNAGKFSEIALEMGVRSVIGMDFDEGALDQAIEREVLDGKDFSPLLYDFANPSPAIGWALNERKTLADRLPQCDGLICLALIHHLVIARNIPMQSFVDLILSLSPNGLVEFVSKDDPMVQGLLANREDIFHDYTSEAFEKCFVGRARIDRVDSENQSRIYYRYRSAA